MPFPPKKVFIDYLALYEEMRAEDRDSLTTFFKTGYELATSYALGGKPVVNQLDEQITSIKTAIYAANDFDDWFRLISRLRSTAEECQKLKTRNNGLSLSCRTLHGLASLIISKMYEDEAFKPLLSAKISERENRIVALEKDKVESYTNRSGRLVSDYNKEIKSLVSELAFLSCIKYIDLAVLYALVTYLPTPTEVEVFKYAGSEGNCTGPLELQLNYCRWLYANQFQTTRKHIGFDDFIQRSINSYHEQEAQELANANRAAALAAAAEEANDAESNNTKLSGQETPPSTSRPSTTTSSASASSSTSNVSLFPKSNTRRSKDADNTQGNQASNKGAK